MTDKKILYFLLCAIQLVKVLNMYFSNSKIGKKNKRLKENSRLILKQWIFSALKIIEKLNTKRIWILTVRLYIDPLISTSSKV
jgi:hypothetical protein